MRPAPAKPILTSWANRLSEQGTHLPRFKDGMIFARLLTLVTLATVIAAGPACAAPGGGVGPSRVVALDHDNRGNSQDEDYRQSEARARGVITGSVVGVDYAHGIVRLTNGRGIVDIFVLPGTGIMRPGNQYGTIADLVRGTRVAVYVSQVGGRLTAELIRIR